MKAGKTIARTTRRAFRKKLITFGVSTFMCLALTATGFAAWMLSNDAAGDLEGNIQVAAVSEAGVEISNLKFATDGRGNPINTFKLEPQEGDEEGLVRWDKTNYEDMDIEISWSLANYQNVSSTFVEFKLPPTIQDLVTKNYIALPAEFTATSPSTETIGEKTYTVYTFNIPTLSLTGDNGSEKLNDERLEYTYRKTGGDAAEGTATYDVDFTLVLTLNWGTAFNKMNPSVYFEEANGFNSERYDEIKTALNELKAAAHGLTTANLLNTLQRENATLAEQYKEETNAGVLLGLISAENQEALFSNEIPPYYVVINATVE